MWSPLSSASMLARDPLSWNLILLAVWAVRFFHLNWHVRIYGQEGKSNSKPLLTAFQWYSVACFMILQDCAIFLDPMITWHKWCNLNKLLLHPEEKAILQTSFDVFDKLKFGIHHLHKVKLYLVLFLLGWVTNKNPLCCYNFFSLTFFLPFKGNTSDYWTPSLESFCLSIL